MSMWHVGLTRPPHPLALQPVKKASRNSDSDGDSDNDCGTPEHDFYIMPPFSTWLEVGDAGLELNR